MTKRSSAIFALLFGAAHLSGCTTREYQDENLNPRLLYGFASCEDVLQYAREHALEMLDEADRGNWDTPMPGGEQGDGLDDSGGEGAPGGDDGADEDGGGGGDPDYSGTNVQEAGVDEPDLIKTDGERILAVAQGHFHYIDARGDTPVLAGSVELPHGWEPELFLYGDRALVMSRSDNYELSESIQPDEWKGGYSYTEITTLTELDLSDPADIKILRVMHVGGGYVSARLVDSVARIVVRSNPIGLEFKSWWDFYQGDGQTEPGDPGEPPDVPPDEPEPDPDEPPPPDGTGDGEPDTGGGEPDTGGGTDPSTGGSSTSATGGLLGGIGFRNYDTEEEAREAAREYNESVLENSTPENWLPQYVLDDHTTNEVQSGLLVSCEQAMRPGSASGLGVLSVITVDLDTSLGLGDAVGIFSTGEIVYASRENLYVATHPWYGGFGIGGGGGVDDSEGFDEGAPGGGESDPGTTGGDMDEPVFRDGEDEDGFKSYVHKFDITEDDKATYTASGEVVGFLMSQWSMSEHEGDLRVASTDYAGWDTTEQQSYVTVLREQEGEGLVQIGQVGNLGMGEEIYAVRFMGDVGYVVTFRQVDPLYTIDISDPTAPTVLGELKITGYSAYLHPVGEGLILGVGQDATEEGQTLGVQVSLFDVSNLQDPTRLHAYQLGEGQSEVEYDHRAFLYWEQDQLVVIPVMNWDWEMSPEGGPYQGAVALRVDRTDGIERLAYVEHPAPAEDPYLWRMPRRSLIIDRGLFTLSDIGLLRSSLDTFEDQGWVPFF